MKDYAAELTDGEKHGQGTFTWASGTKYVGEWKRSSKREGTQYDEDGNVTATYSEGVEKPVN